MKKILLAILSIAMVGVLGVAAVAVLRPPMIYGRGAEGIITR